MRIATIVLSVVMAVAAAGSGTAKLLGVDGAIQSVLSVGFPEGLIWLLAVAELAGAVGLLVGLGWRPIGIAAAAGLTLYFLLAVGSHLVSGQAATLAPALVLMLLALTTLLLRVRTRTPVRA